MRRRAVVALRVRLDRLYRESRQVWPYRARAIEVERRIEEAAEQIAAERRGDDYRKLSPRTQRSKRVNARDVAILGGDPSL
jgi:hypothetical protein